MPHRHYTEIFNEKARLVPELVSPESKRIKRYIQGLPVDVRRSMTTARPNTFLSAVELCGKLYEHRRIAVVGETEEDWNINSWEYESSSYQVSNKKARD